MNYKMSDKLNEPDLKSITINQERKESMGFLTTQNKQEVNKDPEQYNAFRMENIRIEAPEVVQSYTLQLNTITDEEKKEIEENKIQSKNVIKVKESWSLNQNKNLNNMTNNNDSV